MPLKNYHLLKAQVLDYYPHKRDHEGNQHTEILLQAEGAKFRAALNIYSAVAPNEVLMKIEPSFRADQLRELFELSEGLYNLCDAHSNLALDYISDDLISEDQMIITPVLTPRGVVSQITPLLETLKKDQSRFLYCFGEAWGVNFNLRSSPLREGDEYFHFEPEQGIHSLHLNQGESGYFKKDNGRHQDGLVLFENADRSSWTACFFAFQKQSWNNDEEGNPIQSS